MSIEEESGTSAAAPALASPPTLSAEAVKAEVRVLLERNLMSNDDELKIETLHKLANYFAEKEDGPNAYHQKVEHRRAVEHWNGCHLVLLTVQQQLSKADGPHLDVIYGAIRFLANWSIGSSERCDALSRFDGIGVIVQAGKAFLNNAGIGTAAICCFLNFTSDHDEKRLSGIVEGDALHYVIQAMLAHKTNKVLQRGALILLERSCDILGPRHRVRLIEKDMLLALSAAYATFLDSAECRTLCSTLMNKLCVP
jgi:hypothetical protein